MREERIKRDCEGCPVLRSGFWLDLRRFQTPLMEIFMDFVAEVESREGDIVLPETIRESERRRKKSNRGRFSKGQ